MHILIGLAVMVWGFADLKWLARWAGAGQRLRPNFVRMFVALTVGWGIPMAGFYYAESGSLRSTGEAALVTALAFGALMTAFFAGLLGCWRLFSPRSYAFGTAWMDAHAQRGALSGDKVGEGRRRAAVTKQFKERWVSEAAATSAEEFIHQHWEEIVTAERAVTGD
jgi:hypothetical protein